MHRGIEFLAVTCVFSLLAGVTLVGTTWSQPGTVDSYTKINSDTLDTIGAPLADEDEFGDSVAGLGDLDGPGPSVAAFAAGAVGDDTGGYKKGAVHVVFVNASGHVLSRRNISSTEGGFTGTLDVDDEFGSSVAWLGDLDGPGPSVAALAVGAIGDDDGGLNRGAVYVLFLSASGSVLSHKKISDTAGGLTAALLDEDEFGGAVAGLGDLDGPGPSVAALAVGVIHDDDNGPNHGAIFILFLDATGTVISEQKINESQGNFVVNLGSDDNFGEDIANLGDTDGPGGSALTLAVTAVADDDGTTNQGAVYILFLDTAGAVLSYQKISGTHGNLTAPLLTEDNFGTSVVGLGDLDGSGPSVVALAVGAGGDDGPGVDRGAIYVLFLSGTGTVLSHREISSSTGFPGTLDDVDEFGSALATLGDIDGAGGSAQTLLSGASFDDDGGTDRGAVYILRMEGSVVLAAGDPRTGVAVNELRPARPNPFLHGTTIPFRMADMGRVRIDIVDAGGRRVRSLVDRTLSGGEHRAVWDGADDAGYALGAGAYFVRMSIDGRVVSAAAKVMLLR